MGLAGNFICTGDNYAGNFRDNRTFSLYFYKPYKEYDGTYIKVGEIYFCEADEPNFYA